jgi:hypothetical protein
MTAFNVYQNYVIQTQRKELVTMLRSYIGCIGTLKQMEQVLEQSLQRSEQ